MFLHLIFGTTRFRCGDIFFTNYFLHRRSSANVVTSRKSEGETFDVWNFTRLSCLLQTIKVIIYILVSFNFFLWEHIINSHHWQFNIIWNWSQTNCINRAAIKQGCWTYVKCREFLMCGNIQHEACFVSASLYSRFSHPTSQWLSPVSFFSRRSSQTIKHLLKFRPYPSVS